VRDVLEGLKNVAGAHGVFNMTAQDHGFDRRAAVMVQIRNGAWVLPFWWISVPSMSPSLADLMTQTSKLAATAPCSCQPRSQTASPHPGRSSQAASTTAAEAPALSTSSLLNAGRWRTLESRHVDLSLPRSLSMGPGSAANAELA
jgi:hypothetical protein